jgi:hypothetical protein
MAILKFINDPADFTALNATASTNGNFFSTLRIDNGWRIDTFQSFSADWPEPVGNTVWMHFIIGQDGTNSTWVDTLLRFEDANGTQVLRMHINDNRTFWELNGDSNSTISYVSAVNALLVADVEFVKNGTTDITATVYINGTFQGTMTVANTGDRGVPTTISSNPLDTTNSFNFYFGECVIADEDTRGWRLYMLKPTAFGVNQQWDGEATSVVDGSLLTGISTDVLNERASFGLARIENISDSALIDRLAIQTYGQRGASGLTSFNHYFRYDGGTIVDDADIALGLTADLYIDEYELNPNTSLAWEVADIQGLQVGVRART